MSGPGPWLFRKAPSRGWAGVWAPGPRTILGTGALGCSVGVWGVGCGPCASSWVTDVSAGDQPSRAVAMAAVSHHGRPAAPVLQLLGWSPCPGGLCPRYRHHAHVVISDPRREAAARSRALGSSSPGRGLPAQGPSSLRPQPSSPFHCVGTIGPRAVSVPESSPFPDRPGLF